MVLSVPPSHISHKLAVVKLYSPELTHTAHMHKTEQMKSTASCNPYCRMDTSSKLSPSISVVWVPVPGKQHLHLHLSPTLSHLMARMSLRQ